MLPWAPPPALSSRAELPAPLAAGPSQGPLLVPWATGAKPRAVLPASSGITSLGKPCETLRKQVVLRAECPIVGETTTDGLTVGPAGRNP
eukprot:3814261-Pyramimonas_sp.AAC.1